MKTIQLNDKLADIPEYNGELSASIIVQLPGTVPGNSNAIAKAIDVLKSHFGNMNREESIVLAKAEFLGREAIRLRKCSIGIFVSRCFTRLFTFDCDMDEMVVVGDTFKMPGATLDMAV